MKKIVILLTLAMAGSSLFLAGCSKSVKSGSAANNSPSAGPVDLKIKWQIGKEYHMVMDLNQTTDINPRGQPVHQEMKLTQGIHYSPLKDLDGGGHQVQLEFDSENLDFTQNGRKLVSYDSTQKTPVEPNSAGAPVAAAMNAMLGVPLVYTFAADGTVEKIDGVDSLTSRITAAVPNQRQRMQLQQLYDEDTLKQYGQFSESLPDHPVSVGDSWSSSHDINNLTGVMTVNSTYTFKNWEQHDGHNCAHLLITGDIKTKTASATATGAVVKVQKSAISGDAWFDPDLGMFVDVNSDQDMTLDITTRQMALTDHLKQNVELSLQSVDP